MDEKLKPCPFCGGENIIIDRDDGWENMDTNPDWNVFCRDCTATITECTREKAIAAWNKRSGV